jgi:hypothetical protein
MVCYNKEQRTENLDQEYMKLFAVHAFNVTSGKGIGITKYFLNLDQLTSFYGRFSSATGETHLMQLYLVFSSGEIYEVTDYKGIFRFCETMNIMIGDLAPK